MITKIFYSLVLFPDIQYQTALKCGYDLLDIIEMGFGKLKLVFKNGDSSEEIYFTHIDFALDNDGSKTKNWLISGRHQELRNEIYKLVIENEINDFNFFKEKSFYDKIPFGVVLTITSKCNLFCNYCFNDYDYPLEKRNTRKGLGLKEYKIIVDQLYNSGTRDIIITGGEPFLVDFLFDLLDYIKGKGIFVRINTNGTLLTDDTMERLNDNYSMNLMVSMHEFNDKDYFEVNEKGATDLYGADLFESFEKRFKMKILQLRKIQNYKNITLDFLTILNNKNILFLEKIFYFVTSNFHVRDWHFFRLQGTRDVKGIGPAMINLAIHKLYKLNKKYNTDFKIVDSVPFCVTKDIEMASLVIDGELSDHHNIKTIVTTDGNIQIMCSFDSNLGNIFNDKISEIWKGTFVQKMLNQGFLPKECFDCKYKERCRGGSRMNAHMIHGRYDALDPLCNLNNKVVL